MIHLDDKAFRAAFWLFIIIVCLVSALVGIGAWELLQSLSEGE